MEQFDTSSTCLQLEYARLSETQLRVTKRRKVPILGHVGLGHNSYGGSLDIPDGDDQGRMRVKWPLSE